jgi:hypothetical protein
MAETLHSKVIPTAPAARIPRGPLYSLIRTRPTPYSTYKLVRRKLDAGSNEISFLKDLGVPTVKLCHTSGDIKYASSIASLQFGNPHSSAEGQAQDSVSFGLQPLDMGSQAIQAREEREPVHTILVERFLERGAESVLNNDLFHIL